MTKMKSYREEVREELIKSPTLYCCYCTTEKGGKTHCCSEYHFVAFNDMYPSDQEQMILDHVGEYEEWAKKQ